MPDSKTPSIIVRLSARLIDGALVWLVIAAVTSLPSNSELGSQALITGVTLLVGLLILVLAVRTSGRTPGRAILGLKVVTSDGEAASQQRVLTRELLAFGLFAVALGLTQQGTGAVLGLFTNAAALEFAGDGNDAALFPVSLLFPWASAIALTYGAIGAIPGGVAAHDHLARTKLVWQ
ncbi:MAG: RDD family protein [Solirubrobacteraceae bacterium]|nr:RDD family protein [Solirubrobacteraceae bacterium]